MVLEDSILLLFINFANKKTMKIHFYFFLIIIFFASCGQVNSTDSNTAESIPTIDYDAKLKQLGIELTTPTKPVANYVNVVQTGNLLFLAGKGPKMADGKYMTGFLGKDVNVEDGYKAARRVGELQLAVLKNHLGDLNKVKRIVKVLGLVRGTDDFGNQPEVMNGFSDLMVEVFGEKGKHARAALGTNSLPRNICLEIEMIVEIY